MIVGPRPALIQIMEAILLADQVKLDVDTLCCSTPGCDYTVKRGSVIKGCHKCGGKAFVDNVKKAEIEAAQPTKAAVKEDPIPA